MPAPLIWEHLPCSHDQASTLARSLGVTPVFAQLLCQRGLADPDAAGRFLAPSLEHLHDPFKLPDMDRAVDRILAALACHERMAIHGDYDVDGITSTVIVRRTLEMLGADVVHFLPERVRDGYGLHPPAIDRLHAEGVRLVVSVDCGTRSVEAADRARELGLDLIITDHHEPDAALPAALAVINPKRRDSSYPERELAGVGVALKLVQALCGRTAHERWLPAFVKIAAIGTLADVVPVVGENRVIAKLGLQMLSRGPHKVGLRALLDVAGLTGKPIDTYQVAFVIAPRVNAAGRMSTPDIAARLLLASDETMADEVRALAEQLDEENRRRQLEEQRIVAHARKVIETDPDVGARSVLVVAGEGWHRGVIGIVASRLVEAFYRPVVVVSIDGDIAYGSCRSIPSFDMLGALERCSPLLTRFGGHKLAAGLTVEAARVKDLRSALADWGDQALTPDDLRPRLRIDLPLRFGLIRGDLVSELERLAPFGPGNPRPVFSATAVELADRPRRIKDRHLKLALRQDGRLFRAMAWQAVDQQSWLAEHTGGVDVAFSLDQNVFNGETYLELTVADIRKSGQGSSS
jgi:single-stranded-DNA-specific exonuclease